MLCARWCLGPPGAGLAALPGASLIPDAALLYVGHPIYSYFWLQHVAPGRVYGVAIAGTALIIIAQGARERRRLWLVSGVRPAALVALFKVHVFAAAFPLLLCFAILAWPPRKPLRLLVLSVSVAAGLALLPLAKRFYIGLYTLLRLRWLYPLVLENTGKYGYWYADQKLVSGFRRCSRVSLSHLAKAIGLTPLNALQVFAIVAPSIWLVALRR